MFIQNKAAFADAAKVDLEMLIGHTGPGRSGLIAGTLLEAAGGWRPVETLVCGDAVFTFDGGLAAIADLRREERRPDRVLHVPGGILGNCAAVDLMPGQYLLLDDLRAEPAFGTPLVLVPALALAGLDGITWVRRDAPVDLVTPVFEDEEMVWANSGLRLHCPSRAQAAGARPQSDFFRVLGPLEAAALVARMNADGGWPGEETEMRLSVA